MKNVIIDGVEYIEKIQITDFVIVRGKDSGVHAGYLKEEKGSEIILNNSRRLWYWKGAASLSQVAMEGVKAPNECKFPCAVTEIRIKDAIEVIPCTEIARKSIENVPIWSA